MAGEITLHIITPTSRFLSTKVDEVVIPAAKGDMGILPGHTPILTFLGVGLLTYVKEGTSHSLAIKQGFAEIKNDEVIILTDQAFKPGEVDVELAEREMAEAQKILDEKELTDLELEREQIKLAIARTKKALHELKN